MTKCLECNNPLRALPVTDKLHTCQRPKKLTYNDVFNHPHGWIDVHKFDLYIKQFGITFIKVLENDNRVDGQIHRLYTTKYNKKVELKADYWDNSTFKEFLTTHG